MPDERTCAYCGSQIDTDEGPQQVASEMRSDWMPKSGLTSDKQKGTQKESTRPAIPPVCQSDSNDMEGEPSTTSKGRSSTLSELNAFKRLEFEKLFGRR